jgi:hypothetical protein
MDTLRKWLMDLFKAYLSDIPHTKGNYSLPRAKSRIGDKGNRSKVTSKPPGGLLGHFFGIDGGSSPYGKIFFRPTLLSPT